MPVPRGTRGPIGAFFDRQGGLGAGPLSWGRHDDGFSHIARPQGLWGQKMPEYASIARARVLQAMHGTLPVRPMHTPIYDPADAGKALTTNFWQAAAPENSQQQSLLEEPSKRFEETS